MGKPKYYQQISFDDAIDADQHDDDDDDHLTEFRNLIFDELLRNIKNVPYADIITYDLTMDDKKYYDTIESHSLSWLYTADRKNINDEIIYSFRFASPCHPDNYKSFDTRYHSYFKLSNKYRHRSEGWYEYIGQTLPEEIEIYLNIHEVLNEKPDKTKIFVNNIDERLDIEFHFRFNDRYERITITFEPGYPENIV